MTFLITFSWKAFIKTLVRYPYNLAFAVNPTVCIYFPFNSDTFDIYVNK